MRVSGMAACFHTHFFEILWYSKPLQNGSLLHARMQSSTFALPDLFGCSVIELLPRTYARVVECVIQCIRELQCLCFIERVSASLLLAGCMFETNLQAMLLHYEAWHLLEVFAYISLGSAGLKRKYHCHLWGLVEWPASGKQYRMIRTYIICVYTPITALYNIIPRWLAAIPIVSYLCLTITIFNPFSQFCLQSCDTIQNK